MIRTVRSLLEMIRFSHTLFALPFALLAAVLAWSRRSALGGPAWQVRELVGIVLAMVFARTAAMAFNRLADRAYDARNPRTAGRHLPAGLLSVGAVRLFALASGAAFVASTLLWLPENPWPLRLAVPLLLLLLGYSYAKRFTALAHFWLGLALALAPVAAWIAVLQFAGLSAAVLLGAAVLCWVSGFDIIYACQDREFDRRAGLRSVPARLGVPAALKVAAACHAGMVACLAMLPRLAPELGWIFGGGVAAIAVLLVVEHALVRPDDLSRVNVAFFHVNALVSVGLLVAGSLDVIL